VQCASAAGLHRIAYLEWGEPENDAVLICVHGLTRCARDFERFAQAMSDRYRVVCPDVAGRGDSEWLADPALYTIPQYVADMVALIARLDVERVHWVGTSMGGLIGMFLAAQNGTPVARLVMNDAGPVITKASLERIETYLGKAPPLPTIEAAEQYVRVVSGTFGPHSDAEWRFLTEIVVRRDAEGGYRMHYDPRIAEPYRKSLPDKDLEFWPSYDGMKCPTLVLRGERSDVLTRETCAQMAQRGPRATTVEIPGVGHAPTLLHDDQIGIVREFLLS